MDALHDLLRAMNLTGSVFLDAEFTAPWCVAARVGPEDCAAFLPTPAHVIAYHYVTEGRCLVGVNDDPPVDVQAGQLVMLPRNDPHRLGSTLKMRAVNADHLIRAGAGGGLARITHGGGGARTRILCGFLGTDRRHPPIAQFLPSALTITVASAAGAWIESSVRYAAQELSAGRPGSPLVVAKLAELLFVEAVRQHAATLPPDRRGWLAGFSDPVVGRALALLHGRPAYRWTAAALARETGTSRSAFADRFTHLVGEPPIRYLARQRLQAAAERLRERHATVAAIALDVGYASEAAFSRAFKREFGASPAAWRKAALT